MGSRPIGIAVRAWPPCSETLVSGRSVLGDPEDLYLAGCRVLLVLGELWHLRSLRIKEAAPLITLTGGINVASPTRPTTLR
jgi:hypothetical protein